LEWCIAKTKARGYVIEKGIAMKLLTNLCPLANCCRFRVTTIGAGREFARIFGASALLFALIAAPAFANEAAESQGVYWRIEKDGREKGYLLGTIHSEDPRVLDFTEAFITELKSCDVFAMEMVPDLPTLKKLTEYMHFEEPDRLLSILGQERFDNAMQALGSYQVPADWKSRMKVWAVMMTLSVPAPETGFFMDLSLSLRAAGSGLKVVGLETLEQQLQFLEQMPLDYQVELLDHALADYGKVDEVHDEMIGVYLQDNLASLAGLSEQQFKVLDPEISRYFSELGIDARNRHMAASALEQLKLHKVFVTAGALHLPGPLGLIELLRDAGYDLTPMPLPFNPAPQQSAP
jgi:uncharacterized protein YbaP (TraB family)